MRIKKVGTWNAAEESLCRAESCIWYKDAERCIGHKTGGVNEQNQSNI